jgi:hypothetical protein
LPVVRFSNSPVSLRTGIATATRTREKTANSFRYIVKRGFGERTKDLKKYLRKDRDRECVCGWEGMSEELSRETRVAFMCKENHYMM